MIAENVQLNNKEISGQNDFGTLTDADEKLKNQQLIREKILEALDPEDLPI